MELQVQETLAGVERRVVERLDRLESKVDLLASRPRRTLAAPGAGGPTCSTGAGAAGGAPAAGLARRSGPREPAGKGPPRKSQASLVERRLAGVLCEDLERTAGAGAAARPQPPREAAAGCGPLAWAGGALAPAAEPEGLGRVRVQSLSDSSGEQVESLSSEVWTCPTVVVQQDAPSGVLTLEGGGLSMASLSAPSCQNERKPSRQAAELLKDLKAQEEQVETKVGKRAFTSQHRRKIMKRADAFRHTTDTARQGRLAGILAKAVSSTQFDLAITGIVFLNSLLIGAQVQHNAVSDKTVDAFVIMEFSCTAVFTVELCLRLAVHRSRFFTNPQECWWNVFDFVLVGLSLLDAFISLTFDGGLEGPGAFMGKLGRAIRMFRIVRIIRTVRFLSQLRVMLHMIVSSLQSLFWILVIMLGLIYMFAVVLTQGAADYLKDPSIQVLYAHTDEYQQVLDMYGSLFDTVYTLFMCMSGGINWGTASQPMRGPGWVLEAIVIGFVFFMVFAVTNIVNGVFVDGAIELARRDRTTMLEKQREDEESNEKHLIHLLTLMDTDGDQTITFDEFAGSLESKEVVDYISALEVEISDAKVFFQMLDVDGSGKVDIIEFISGMRKFRGEAKSVDIQMMIHENKKLFKLVSGLVGVLLAQEDDEHD